MFFFLQKPQPDFEVWAQPNGFFILTQTDCPGSTLLPEMLPLLPMGSLQCIRALSCEQDYVRIGFQPLDANSGSCHLLDIEAQTSSSVLQIQPHYVTFL